MIFNRVNMSKKKDDEKKKIEELEGDLNNNFGGVFGGLKDVFFNYGKNISKLPWNEMPKEGFFLIFFVLSFMIASFVVYIKLR